MTRQERCRTAPRKRTLVVTGDLRMPSSILSWERDLLEPSLAALMEGSRDEIVTAPRTEGDARD